MQISVWGQDCVEELHLTFWVHDRLAPKTVVGVWASSKNHVEHYVNATRGCLKVEERLFQEVSWFTVWCLGIFCANPPLIASLDLLYLQDCCWAICCGVSRDSDIALRSVASGIAAVLFALSYQRIYTPHLPSWRITQRYAQYFFRFTGLHPFRFSLVNLGSAVFLQRDKNTTEASGVSREALLGLSWWNWIYPLSEGKRWGFLSWSCFDCQRWKTMSAERKF